METLPEILDLLLVVLLAVTIFYAVLLSRRLSALRRNEAEMRTTLEEFGDAAARAEASLSDFKSATALAKDNYAMALEERKRAEATKEIHDDLMFLVNRGEKLADRLEDLVRSSAAPPSPTSSSVAEMPPPSQTTRSGSLQMAARGNGAGPKPKSEPARSPQPKTKEAGAVAAVDIAMPLPWAEQAADRVESMARSTEPAGESRAEHDLMRKLQASTRETA